MAYQHTPVMLKEAIEILNPRSGQKFIDCTLGGGGYSRAILERIGEQGKVLAIDLDGLAIANAKLNFKTEIKNKKLILAHENFKNLRIIIEKYFTADAKFDGLALDLGLSSAQLEDRGRGFSFNLPDAPLGMNFGDSISERAGNIINNWSARDLAGIFKDYGEEKFAYKIALAIVKERQIQKIATAGKLAEIITKTKPAAHWRKFQLKIHPATKIFQALRLAVNQELENLRSVLPQALDALNSGGRLVVISYHSLEDRIVKQYFKEESKDCLCPPRMPVCRCGHKAGLKILAHKVLGPGGEEVLKNQRSRSAKLRAASKI